MKLCLDSEWRMQRACGRATQTSSPGVATVPVMCADRHSNPTVRADACPPRADRPGSEGSETRFSRARAFVKTSAYRKTDWERPRKPKCCGNR